MARDCPDAFDNPLWNLLAGEFRDPVSAIGAIEPRIGKPVRGPDTQ
jgi:hypothetical protein